MKNLISLILVCCVLSITPTLAQRILPAEAKKGSLTMIEYPMVMLDEEPARLAPGAIIRNEQNLIVVPGALPPEVEFKVRYFVDTNGELSRIWILTQEEIAGRPKRNEPSIPGLDNQAP